MVRAVLALSSSALLAGCALFTDFGGFSSGAEGADASADVAANETSGELDASEPPDADAPEADTASDASSQIFVDDFNRADGVIGNGWVEKTAGSWAISTGVVVPLVADINYRRHLLYRPTTEDVLDVEVSVEVTPNQSQPGYPQIFARARPLDIANPESYDGYILYVPGNAAEAVITRQRGPETHTPLSTFAVNPAINTANSYRFVLTVKGTTPVELAGRIERKTLNGFDVIGETKVVDGTGERIGVPGSVGVSGNGSLKFRYDNFRRTPL